MGYSLVNLSIRSTASPTSRRGIFLLVHTSIPSSWAGTLTIRLSLRLRETRSLTADSAEHGERAFSSAGSSVTLSGSVLSIDCAERRYTRCDRKRRGGRGEGLMVRMLRRRGGDHR